MDNCQKLVIFMKQEKFWSWMGVGTWGELWQVSSFIETNLRMKDGVRGLRSEEYEYTTRTLTYIHPLASLSLSAVLSSEKCLSLCLKFNHKHCHYSSNVPLCERETDRLTQDKFLNFLHSLIDIWTDSDGDCINDRRRNSRKIPQFISNSILGVPDLGEGGPGPGLRRTWRQVWAAGARAGASLRATLLRPSEQRDGGGEGRDGLPALPRQVHPGRLHGEAQPVAQMIKLKLLRGFDSVMSSNAPETKTITSNCLTIKLYGICLEFICSVLA